MIASSYNDYEMVVNALEEGADAEYFVIGKGSPLDSAISGSSMSIIHLLIENGATPTLNSLNVATFVGRSDVIQLLKSLQ